ncbi:thiaminase II [Terrilactibacillus laevilacticus]|uniref:Aminopyrimidine aminohydrolase n=1 Tax=Terrilactibacillus laevilacticus TaxID=1380157 RepID=A0ABW5PMH6_9BACI|nr:thiaminase II [Terrilactibacillus laevilacticus]
MTFSDQLKQKAAPILQEIYQHPFVKGIEDGTLPKEAIKFYVQQDFLYLNAFVKIYAQAITKSTTREDMDFFQEQIHFTLHSETIAHENLCQVANLSLDQLKGGTLAPTTFVYQQHMLEQGRDGTILDVLAGLIPCPWTYWEIGKHIMNRVSSLEGHPFKDWIEFYGKYGSEDMTFAEELFRRLDEKAQGATKDELNHAENVFLKSCELEWRFWEMSFYQEDWKFNSLMKIY